MKTAILVLLFSTLIVGTAQGSPDDAQAQVLTNAGLVEGVHNSGIREFKGIPYARPPTGELRWRAPQAPIAWEGVRQTKGFGPRCMQLPVFGDMNFRSDGMDEDCLYLNVWTPVESPEARLPVLVYFYGGGFIAGDGSEPRYDGESMARKGIVTVTVNYRLGVFGFFAHPELSRESAYGGSGNYGLLDQSAALQWVQKNIVAFGGDPQRVTIAGESAGSISVSAQMLSPLSMDLFAAAIGESGSVLRGLGAVPLAEAEESGTTFAEYASLKSLSQMRALPAQALLESTAKEGLDNLAYGGNIFSFPIAVDGHFFPESPESLYESGQVAKVPLLLGWNSQEMSYQFVFQDIEPTPEAFKSNLWQFFGPHAEEALALYSGQDEQAIKQAATDLAGDLFIAYSTWKWGDVHSRVGEAPVYRYLYSRPRPAMLSEYRNAIPGLADSGAVHSAEIEYAMGNLPTNRVYDWQPEDYTVSAIMQEYFANFVKSGNPNGLGLPEWPTLNGSEGRYIMEIDVDTHALPAPNRERYLFLDRVNSAPGE